MKTTQLDLPGYRLHICDTGDALADTCFAFESPTAIVCLEAPAFQPDVDAWKAHLATLGKPIAAVLTPYHVGGAEQLGETWATARTCASLQPGGPIHGLATGFNEAFPGAFPPPATPAPPIPAPPPRGHPPRPRRRHPRARRPRRATPSRRAPYRSRRGAYR